MKRGYRYPFCTYLLIITLFVITTVHPSWAATPVVDDTTFILNAGSYKAPFGDLDLLLLREHYFAGPINLTAFDNPDPGSAVITGNPLTFGSPDCVQSILVRWFDAAAIDIFRTSIGTITFIDGPTSNVRILGVLTDVTPGPQIDIQTNLDGSDDVFQDAAVANILNDAAYRRLEGYDPPRDIIAIDPSRKSLTFTLKTSSGADDFRILLDYGDGVCPATLVFPSGDFPPGVKFDINLVDNISTTKGVRVGETEFGEAISVLGIPLTASATPSFQSPTRIPDVNYFGHTLARDVNKNYGGDDDNIAIYYYAVDPGIAFPGSDFYIWILDGDNNATGYSGTGTNDVNVGFGTGISGQSVFEYMLFGGPTGNASQNEDIVSPGGGNPIDFGNDNDPTNDFSGTLIDINPNRSSDLSGRPNSSKTLSTDVDTGPNSSFLRDQDWTIIGIDIDTTAGYVIPISPPSGSLDEKLASLFGSGKQIYKLVVDGRDIRDRVAAPGATDFNRYQLDISTSPTNLNTGDCTGVKPLSNCVVPFAYELVFAGRPQSQIPIRTETFVLIPPLSTHQLDIQTLDLDQATAGGALGAEIAGASATVIRGANRPNQITNAGSCPFPVDNTSTDNCTFESGNQLPSNTDITYLWTSLRQTQRTTGSNFPSVKDGTTCGPGPYSSIAGLCYDSTNYEDVLWKVSIDPFAPVNPYGLRAFTDDQVAALVPVASTPPDNSPPTNPTNLGASPASSTQIDLSWTASFDNTGIASYRIYRVDPSDETTVLGLLTTVSGSLTSSQDIGRTANTKYCYLVTAVDLNSNQSGGSNVACATTPAGADTQAPTAPTGLTATAVSQTQINLSWSASTDNVGVTAYEIFRCQSSSTSTDCTPNTSGTPNATVNGSTLNYPDSGLTAGTRYCYVVRARDAANNTSTPSNTACDTTFPPPSTAPTPPGPLSATAVGQTQNNLSWGASTDDVGVTGYRIFRCQPSSTSTDCIPNTNGTPIATLSGATLAYPDTGLNPNTRYCYLVLAVDGQGNLSPPSNLACATTLPDTTPPSIPHELEAEPESSSQIDVDWEGNPITDGVHHYDLYRSLTPGGPFTFYVTVMSTMYSDTGLTPSTQYCYQVRAVDGAGNASNPSNIDCATTFGFDHPATVKITPKTINLGTSGVPINADIAFDQTMPASHVAADICITGVNSPTGCPTNPNPPAKIKMHFPPKCPAPPGPPCSSGSKIIPPPLDHMSGTEIFNGNNSLNVKFDRLNVEARLDPADHVMLQVKGLLKDGHIFSGVDTVTVNP